MEDIRKCQCGLVMRSADWPQHSWTCHIGEPMEVQARDVTDLIDFEDAVRQSNKTESET